MSSYGCILAGCTPLSWSHTSLWWSFLLFYFYVHWHWLRRRQFLLGSLRLLCINFLENALSFSSVLSPPCSADDNSIGLAGIIVVFIRSALPSSELEYGTTLFRQSFCQVQCQRFTFHSFRMTTLCCPL